MTGVSPQWIRSVHPSYNGVDFNGPLTCQILADAAQILWAYSRIPLPISLLVSPTDFCQLWFDLHSQRRYPIDSLWGIGVQYYPESFTIHTSWGQIHLFRSDYCRAGSIYRYAPVPIRR